MTVPARVFILFYSDGSLTPKRSEMLPFSIFKGSALCKTNIVLVSSFIYFPQNMQWGLPEKCHVLFISQVIRTWFSNFPNFKVHPLFWESHSILGKDKHSKCPNRLLHVYNHWKLLTFTVYLYNPLFTCWWQFSATCDGIHFSQCCHFHWPIQTQQSPLSYFSSWLEGLILGKLDIFPAPYGNFVLFCGTWFTKNSLGDDSHQSHCVFVFVFRQYQIQGVANFHLNKEQQTRNEK